MDDSILGSLSGGNTSPLRGRRFSNLSAEVDLSETFLGSMAVPRTGLLGRHPMAVHAHALHYIGLYDNPAARFSLRAIDPDRYQIVNEAEGGYVMEEIEESKAFFQVYDGAVYMFQAWRLAPSQQETGSLHLPRQSAPFPIPKVILGKPHRPLKSDEEPAVFQGISRCITLGRTLMLF